jgi:HEAT repeat protein
MSKYNLQPAEIYQRRDELGIKNSKDMLVEIIETSKDNSLRQKAIKYIGVIGNEMPSLQEEIFKKLENLIVSEENVEIKTDAVKALGKLNYEKGLKPLKWLLQQEDLNYN